MGKIRARSDNNKLFFEFRFYGTRCREQTTLTDKPSNRKRLQKVLDKIDAEITLGVFEYGQYFPHSPMAKKIANRFSFSTASKAPRFADFAKQ